MMRRLLTGLAIVLSTAVLWAQTPLTPIMNLMGRTDASGRLFLSPGVATGAQTPLTPIGNLKGATDSSGNLLVTESGGTSTPDSLCLDGTNHDTCWVRGGAQGAMELTGGTNPVIQIGGATNAFPELRRNGTIIEAKLADGSAATGFNASTVSFSTIQGLTQGHLFFSETSPSALSACGSGTAPSFAWNNGTAAFEIITGSTTPVSTCTWTMPAATNKWVCDITDITTQTANVFVQKMSASSTNSVTMTNYNTAGAATAVVASDHLLVKCLGG
jgi:hypothetical protein